MFMRKNTIRDWWDGQIVGLLVERDRVGGVLGHSLEYSSNRDIRRDETMMESCPTDINHDLLADLWVTFTFTT